MECTVVNINQGDFDIYIGRGSKWGNPYSHKQGTRAEFVVNSRQSAIEMYEQYLLDNKDLMESLPELVGKKLGCFCHPRSCHGDILAKYVNGINEALW